MSVRSFRLLLKVVEIIAPLLGEIANLCSRVDYNLQEMHKKSYYQRIFREYLKVDAFRTSLDDRYASHLSIENRSEVDMEISSNRLSRPTRIVG